jgi:putative PEP-CTERM system histidine kinase
VTLHHSDPLSLEELELLQSMCRQVAGNLVNLKLSERLRQTKEMAAFQNVAAFFVHDLKNVASKLSMTVENMAIHYENPAFREDALRLMSQSVEQVKALCGHLTSLREKSAISPTRTDVNKVVKSALAGVNGTGGSIHEAFGSVPTVMIDREQMQKVLTNLVLNACEAVGERGEIHVRTMQRNGWIVVEVEDNGCGMSREYMEQSLFRPFQSTKSKGLGIGLFQSKMIVEAHKGRIEVESREGEGTIFRVLLPIG